MRTSCCHEKRALLSERKKRRERQASPPRRFNLLKGKRKARGPSEERPEAGSEALDLVEMALHEVLHGILMAFY